MESRGCKIASSFKLRAASFGAIVLCCWGCSNTRTSEAEVKFQQYYVQGEQLYLKNCSNCHQTTGKGLGLVYPPLDKSDFMDAHLEEVLCLMKYGRNGELQVNGKSYIQPMPGVASLTDLEIAEIATYIYNSWEHQKGMIEVSAVSRVMRECEKNR